MKDDSIMDNEAEQARLDAAHDQAVEESMQRECSNCGYIHTQDAASSWECLACGAWNDEDLDDLP
jgi:rubrerythrin